MEKPLVSICIPNYNYGHYLEHCFESVYQQTYDNIEVIFRDNQSSDDSYDIATRWRKKFRERGIFCSVTENKRNVGSDLNSKRCSRASEGRYLYTLASDDAIKPTFIEECVNVFENNPSVGFVMIHRELIDEHGNITQEPSFYNQSCFIPGEEQAAVFMMAGIAIPGQRMTRKGSHLAKIAGFAYTFQVAGDWYDNFLYACAADVAYIAKPLCQYRVHTGNETNESELRLMGIFEHFQLINAFNSIAKSVGYQKPQLRYKEAVRKLGDMCLRYTMKMLQNNRSDVAKQYMNLAPVFKPDIVEEKQYQEFLSCLNLTGVELEKRCAYLQGTYSLERKVSYNPPEGFKPLDDLGRIIE